MKKFLGKLGSFILGVILFGGFSFCIIMGCMVLMHIQLSLELIGVGALVALVLTCLTMWDVLRD